MAEEISLIREYEAIIKAMKEQIAVLKGKINLAKAENRSFSLENASLADKSQLSMLSQKAQEADALGQELRSTHDLIQKLHSDKRTLEKRLDQSMSKEHLRDERNRVNEGNRAKAEAELKRLKLKAEELKRENEELKRDMDGTRGGKYDDLSSTQRTRHLVIERKIHTIETENKGLKEKLVGSEMEKRQLNEKALALALKLQDYDLVKAKIKKANDDLQSRELVIASLTEQLSSYSPGKRKDPDLTKANLEEYKAQLQSQRNSHAPISPQSRSPRTSSGVHSPRRSNDLRISEIVQELRKTQEQVASLTKARLDREWEKRTGSPRDSSFEGSSFEDSRQTERKRPALPAEVPKSPSHQDLQKPSPHLTTITETPMLSKLQLLRGMKKPAVTPAKPTTEKRPLTEPVGYKSQMPTTSKTRLGRR